MSLIEALRPYLWLAAIAFMVGFLSYVAMGPATPAMAAEPQAVVPTASLVNPDAPVSNAWNAPKRI